jgi:hypothetical protein
MVYPLVHPPRGRRDWLAVPSSVTQGEVVAQVQVLTSAVRVPLGFGPVVEQDQQTVTHPSLLPWYRE